MIRHETRHRFRPAEMVNVRGRGRPFTYELCAFVNGRGVGRWVGPERVGFLAPRPGGSGRPRAVLREPSRPSRPPTLAFLPSRRRPRPPALDAERREALLAALRLSPEGLDRRQVRALFGGSVRKACLDRLLSTAVREGLVNVVLDDVREMHLVRCRLRAVPPAPKPLSDRP